MALTFDGDEIPGVVLGFAPPPFAVHPYETHFAGVNGVSRISGGCGRRVIELAFLLFNQYGGRDDLRAAIENLNDPDGGTMDSNGTLTFEDNDQGLSNDFEDCTFEGFTTLNPPGELLDVAGTLDGGWFAIGVLRFVQLSRSG